MTPVTGSSLGARAFTYDDFGRLKTEINRSGCWAALNERVGGAITSPSRGVCGSNRAGVSASVEPCSRAHLRTRRPADARGTTTCGFLAPWPTKK